MTIPLFGSTGALFDRMGKIGNLIKAARAYQLSQVTNMTDTTNGVVAQFNTESDIQAVMGSSYISQANAPGGIGSVCQQLANLTVNRMVFRDDPQINQNLQQINTQDSIIEIIRQMQAAGATVLAATITGTPTTFTGTGNGVINFSAKRPIDGLVLENSYSENLLFTVTSDSYNGSANLGNESLQVTGVGSQSDVFAFDWPLGSNSINSIQAINGESDNSQGNLLTNSDYEDWTGNLPDNYIIDNNVLNDTITRETTIVYTGTSSLCLTGDAGNTNTQWRQLFNDSTGTNGALRPQTQYGYCVFMRGDGVAAGAGVLQISLVDENDVTVDDENGVANSFTIDLTALTTNFQSFTGVFRTPAIMPNSIYLKYRLTTPLTDNRSVYMDKASLGLMTQLYVSGPYVSVHSGSVGFEIGDWGNCQVTNSRGAAGTLDTFQTLWARLLPDMMSEEFLLPSSNVPTISDSLIG